MTEKHKGLFEDLGKPTLRGVRKCPKCGFLNGTRGLSCKNKDCRMVFKVVPGKNKVDPIVDAVKIVSNSPLQIYSVKMNDFKDDFRCFVLLPIIDGIETVPDQAEAIMIKRSASQCYAPDCRKPVDNPLTITLNLNPCDHTTLVIDCLVNAEPLPLKKAVLKAMPITEAFKEEIYSLATKPDEHLVQRVTKNSIVVKCHPTDVHPLGYLHFTLFEPSKSAKKFKIICGCQTQLTKPFVPKREKIMCLHYYMCICAFASNAKLLEEFKSLVQTVFSVKPVFTLDPSEDKIEIRETETDINDLKEFFIDDICPPSKKRKTYALECLPTALVSFEQWLASVTERINQTMHYQFSGTPDTLVFQVPQVFFDILQQRLASGARKKRLPNSIVSFNNKHSLPLGIVSRYTWHITNILHVKRIFDTPEVPLEITKSFVENRDGTFSLYEPVKDGEEDLAHHYRKTLNNLLIKPLELKTFLKVGNMSLEQKEPTPFIVEWMPDVLPKTHVGELKITFEYGHERNGVLETRIVSPISSTAK